MPPVLGDLTVGDALQVDFRGELFGQRIINTFKYELFDVPPVPMDRWAAYNTFFTAINGEGDLIEKFLTCLSNLYVLKEVRLQFRLPQRMLFRTFVTNVTGSIDEVVSSANTAVSIKRRTTEVHTRRGVGRLQLAGVPDDDIAAGLVTDAAMVNLQALADEMEDNIAPIDSGNWQPVLWTERETPLPPHNVGHIIETVVQRTARVMRRRTVGLGE